MAYTIFSIFVLIILDFVNPYLPLSQIQVLNEFYNALIGDKWSQCQWCLNVLANNDSLSQIYCGLLIKQVSNNTHTVHGIYFDFDNNLNGSIPESIELLQDLETIYLWYNPLITGLIPSSICNLTYLSTIDVNDMNWFGIIPQCIARMPSITYIRFISAFLSMTDTFIQLLCENIPNLEVFQIQYINYTGSIPECMGQKLLKLKNIVFRDMDNLNGTIPESFTNFNHLYNLRLKHLPNLYGTFPSDILKYNNFEFFDITKTSLSGTIPMEYLCNQSNHHRHLIELELESNKNLPIMMPKCIGKLINLRIFKLGGSMIHGSFPDICNLKNLTLFQIAETSMDGTLPNCFGLLSELQSIDLRTNNFHGEFPPILSSKITVLDIQSNFFEGSISNIFPLNQYPNLAVIVLHI